MISRSDGQTFPRLGCTTLGGFPHLDTFIPDLARAVEERGFESLWIGEHTHLPVATKHVSMVDGILPDRYKRFPDPWVVLACAGAATTNLRLGTLIALVAEHNPLALAKQIATLDLVTAGRVEVGIGYGWNRLEMINNGIDPAQRRAVLREKVLAIKALWTSEHTAFAGKFVNFSHSWSLPHPSQEPHPPILLGAAPGSATFADVVEFCDGYLPIRSMTEDGLGDHLHQLRRTAEQAGRDPATLTVSVAYPETAYGRITKEKFLRRLPTRRTLAAYQELGIQRVVCAIPNDDPDFMMWALDEYAKLQDR